MIVIVMGVTGCGKTTVGQLLAETLGWPFFDADDFHPTENVEKMRQGIPLDDSDRAPWLARLNTTLQQYSRQPTGCVLACSALKKQYRTLLSEGLEHYRFVFLNGDFHTIQDRLSARVGHYMNPELLQSQFDALEEPSMDEQAVRVHVGDTPEKLLEKVLALLEIGIPTGKETTHSQ